MFSSAIRTLNKLIGKEEPVEKKQSQQLLFTPGPLCTSDRVKNTMNIDYGSRDPAFIKYIADIRSSLLDICKVKKGEYESVIIQGSGSYGVEATLQTAIPRSGAKLLICINGAYGDRIKKMATLIGIPFVELRYQDNQQVQAQCVLEELQKDSSITHVACIHSETTSGIINDVITIGKTIKQHNPKIQFIVDAMSSFGVYELFPSQHNIDYLVASSNKNLQGIPGFAFVIAKTDLLEQTKGNSRSLVLDLYDQWVAMDKNGQFRFTPPTHVIRATKEAIDEYLEEGGIKARFERYNKNQKYLVQEMGKLGFEVYITQDIQGCIITTFLQPINPEFNFKEFYDYLAVRGYVIYPGKLTVAETFRMGSIGHIDFKDFQGLITQIKEYLKSKKIAVPVKNN